MSRRRRAERPSVFPSRAGTILAWRGTNYDLRERPEQIARVVARHDDSLVVEFASGRLRLLEPDYDGKRPDNAA